MSILLLMVIMGISIFQTTIQTRHMSTFLKNSSEAQYLAEAGIRDALATLDNLGFAARNNASNFPLTSFGAGTYDATVTETGGRVLLTSVGTVNNVSKTVSVEVAETPRRLLII
jgi:Tfp pilus assembly protein PilX